MMKRIQDILAAIGKSAERARRRYKKAAEALRRALANTGVSAGISAVRKGCVYLVVGTQSEKTQIECFLKGRLLEEMERTLGPGKITNVKVRVIEEGE